jgi:formate dehydrogenase
MKRVGDRYVEATWDEAVADIASRLRTIMDRDGPDAIGAYGGSAARSLAGRMALRRG